MFARVAVLVAVTALPMLARAEPSAPPPELKATVDAFAGRWALDGSITMPDGKAVKAPVALDCKKASLGKAVTCSMAGKVPGMGPFEGSFLIGYDTFSKAVHFMGITSDEEVHDHRCLWKGQALACDPLKGGFGGEPITEDLSFSFEGKGIRFLSTTTMKDGGKLVFEGNGRRR
jgi:hypothetical protein